MPSIKNIVYETPSQPKQLRLDTVGNNCNASCLSCHRRLSKRTGKMPMDMIRRILNDVSSWNQPLNEIVPVNYGELFTRPDWETIITKIAIKLPFTKIVIPTNGSLLNEKAVRFLCSVPTLYVINFSVNAYFAETYEYFTGLKAEVIERIKTFVMLISQLRKDVTIWVSMVYDPEYQPQLDKDFFMEYWSHSPAVPQLLAAASAGRKVRTIAPLKIPCRSIFSDFVIGFDGKLSSCCFDASFNLDLGYYSGDAKKDWLNPKLQRLRELHNAQQREEYELCRTCSFG